MSEPFVDEDFAAEGIACVTDDFGDDTSIFKAAFGFRKAGELLVWLALHGPASRDKIIDALWDGSNEQRHLEYFKVAVRRLRAALEEAAPLEFNPLPFEAGTYRLSSRFEIDLDAQALTQAFELNDPARQSQAWNRYTGDFLPGIDSEWVLETRRNLLDQALDLAHEIGGQLEVSDPDAATLVYKQAIKLESTDVRNYLALIQHYRRLKQPSNAARMFKTYVRILAEHYAEQPDPELVRALGGSNG